ncbi:MAG TPA: cytochrome P450 [Polyangiales bacterium]|nr:cytochrome P450 [Polyangiales bacterium]
MTLDSIPLVSGAEPGIGGHAPLFDRDRFDLLHRITREVEDLGRVRFPTRDIVFANSPRAIHELFVEKAKHFAKSPSVRGPLYPLAGEGLFTSEGELWRKQRRMMSPVFHRAKIDALADVMVECAEHACASWSDGGVVDIAHETTRIAMNVAGRTLFGMDTSDEADEIGRALTVSLDWANYALRATPVLLQMEVRLALLRGADRSNVLARPLNALAARLERPIMWPTKRNRKMQSAIALLDARVQRMIDQRRASNAAQHDFLSHLLHARDDDGGAMSDKQLRDEILTIFIAGHETTATGLAWAMYSLARNPPLYARARATVDALGGRPPVVSDLESLEFLGCVFKESLRLYPPVYLMGRIATTDTSLAGHAIPKHTVIVVSPLALHRRADLWTQPLRFDPDRFSSANAARQPQDAYIPFGDGPRICIGAHFAQLEAPLVLARLFQRADFKLASDVPILPDNSATLRPRNGVPMNIRLRPTYAREVSSSLTT